MTSSGRCGSYRATVWPGAIRRCGVSKLTASPSDARRTLLGTGRPWALHWARAGSAPVGSAAGGVEGSPSTHVTVCSRTPSVWAASVGPSMTRRPGNVHGSHEPATAVVPMAHPPSLAHRNQLHGFDRTEILTAVVIDQSARVQREAGTEESLAPLVRADEADILAVGLGCGAQTQPVGLEPYLVLGHLAHREQRAGQLVLAQHGHHVGLVLQPVGSPAQPESSFGRGHTAGVMPGGHGVETEGPGPSEQAVELEVAVALDARVGGPALGVSSDVGVDHLLRRTRRRS